MDAPRQKDRTTSLWNRLRETRQRLRDAFAEIRLLRQQNVRLFQRRLDQLQLDLGGRMRDVGAGTTLDGYMQDFERSAVELALDHSDGDLAQAAMLLGMSAEALRKTVERYEILVDEQGGSL